MAKLQDRGEESSSKTLPTQEKPFLPLAKLPQIVERIIFENGTHRSFILKYLSKVKLAEIEKSWVKHFILKRRSLNIFYALARLDAELKRVIPKKRLSFFRKLHPVTRSHLLEVIADDIWQNIFDALLDEPELRKWKRLFLSELLGNERNYKIS